MKFLFTLDYTKTVFFIFLTLCIVDGRGRRRAKRGNGKCNEYSFAEYNLTFFGDWSKENFPRMYPRYRPKAQWSQLIGRTHGRTYHMWSEGQYASPALQKFVEERNTMLFDREAQGYNDTRDLFTAAPIRGGVGRSSLRIFADGQHSKLSFVVKVIPSPDWFVGVDSLDLCKNGHWRRKIYAHLRPMDAGTDRGFTYTSPNWPAFPQEKIFQITPNFPNHPASSFYDESQARVPRMAHAIVEKVVEYRKKGSPRMPLDSGPSAIVYEQEHERQERFRLVMRPTDAVTASPEKPSLADSDYLTRLNAELQRKLQKPAISRQRTLFDLELLKGPKPTSTLRRQLVIRNTLLDSPASETIRPTMQSRDSVLEKHVERSKTIRQQLAYANPPHVADQKPTPVLAERNSESPEEQTEISEHSEKTDKYMDTDYQDMRIITPKLVLQKHLVMSARRGTVKDDDLYDISQTEGHSHAALQTVPDPTENTNTTDTDYSQTDSDVTRSHPSEIAPTRSSTEVDTERRPIYGEAYRTDYMRDFSARENAGSIFGILSDTPTKSNVRDTDTTYRETTDTEVRETEARDKETTNTRTTDSDTTDTGTTDIQEAEPTEDVQTETQIYIEEAARHREERVVPVKTTNKEVVQNETESHHQYHDNHDDHEAGSTVKSEPPSYHGTRFQNTGYEDNVGDLDCIVGEWSDWSSCSKTCGFGVKRRSRTVTQYEQNRGLPCPRLDQEALCGSMRNCKWNYFSNIFSTNPKRRRRRRRWHTRHG
ncbi:uncharacterized protein LOC121382950 [Gigantopelta aegis]|uniref:uncharacterized protein LOC121382950 n=1 Tax=Gigantopelta aegis TaxID=1735272 RepID=UPI001B88E3E4|nr:uncharacterized protein LOC121382950 [Gigantopelta aegis]